MHIRHKIVHRLSKMVYVSGSFESQNQIQATEVATTANVDWFLRWIFEVLRG